MGGFLACILAGAAMSIQGVMNTRLSEHIGTMETNAFVQCVAAVLSLLVLVFWRTGSFAALGAAPKYCWFGGVLALAAGVALWRYHRVAVKQFGGITGDLAGWFLQKAELYMLAALVFCQWKGFL